VSLDSEIRRALAELELVSHAPIGAYGRQAHDTTDSTGGRRPPGSDAEFRPRKPSTPFREGDAASEKVWSEYEEELLAWEACYHRRTVDYYRRREPSDALLIDIRRTVEAWRRQRIPPGQAPARADPQWKRYIAESNEDGGELARKFGVTRQYIHQVRKAYRLQSS
jgi:hypothetical protein